MLECENLSRYYGSFRALHELSFSLVTGEVVGLLGVNGAGKTTCLRLVTGYLQPHSGRITIDGIDTDLDPHAAREKIGYLPETPPLYPELDVESYLHFVARLRGVAEEAFEEEFLRVTTLTRLQPARRSLISRLSLGYRKRVGIAQAMIGSPPLLVLDEPISGLDPRQIVEMRNLIREVKDRHTILLSSHILTEVSQTCDRVIIIHRGQLLEELRGKELAQLEKRFLELTTTPQEVGA